MTVPFFEKCKPLARFFEGNKKQSPRRQRQKDEVQLELLALKSFGIMLKVVTFYAPGLCGIDTFFPQFRTIIV